MIGYQYDDGGRKESGRRGEAGDCVVRAIAIAAGVAYDAVYEEVAWLNKEYGNGRLSARDGVGKEVVAAAMEEFGFRRVERIKLWRNGHPDHPTLTEAHERYGDCVALTRVHAYALVGGRLRDTADGRVWVDSRNNDRERTAMSVWVRRQGP